MFYAYPAPANYHPAVTTIQPLPWNQRLQWLKIGNLQLSPDPASAWTIPSHAPLPASGRPAPSPARRPQLTPVTSSRWQIWTS